MIALKVLQLAPRSSPDDTHRQPRTNPSSFGTTPEIHQTLESTCQGMNKRGSIRSSYADHYVQENLLSKCPRKNKIQMPPPLQKKLINED